MAFLVQSIALDGWLEVAKSFRDYSFTHFWAYADHAAQRVGAVSKHVAIYAENGELVGLCDVRIKKLPMGLGGIAYISGGPMVDRGDGSAERNLPLVLDALKQSLVVKQGLVLRISQRHKPAHRREAEAAIYRQNQFTIYGSTNATILMDLTPSLEDLRKSLHQKWRNVLNKSERQNIEIVSGQNQQLFDDFSGLFHELVTNKGFDVNLDDRFFSDVQRCSPPQEQFHMAIAYHDEKAVAGQLSSICGETSVYLLGAANETGRKLGAAYLLQWHTISESRHQGCRYYDLGGIDREENPSVFLFKQRMGGEETAVASVYQYAEGIRAIITLFLEKIYRLIC